MEVLLNELYREIAITVDKIIPENWGKFFFYAQVSNDGGGTYFFYSPVNDPEIYEYSLKIPQKFQINEKEFEENEMKLFNLAEKVREIFKENDQELWYSFTLSLDNSGKLNLNFDYTDWHKTNYGFSDQLKIWKYKYLKMMPVDERGQQLISRYLAEYPNNPI
ncbi:immunity protein YezG family protein [Paenibacillus sp. NPDC058910]|uniref:immunity protein YezG family protein n=1 Tax=unclassified Paenibacillus TaxID=185978 RepID=UPI00369781B7